MLGVRVGKITWWTHGWNGQYRKFWHTINWMLISWGEMIPINWNNPSIENWVPLGSLHATDIKTSPVSAGWTPLHLRRADSPRWWGCAFVHNDKSLKHFFLWWWWWWWLIIIIIVILLIIIVIVHIVSLMMFIISIIVVLVHLETLSQHFFRHLSQHFLTCFLGKSIATGERPGRWRIGELLLWYPPVI